MTLRLISGYFKVGKLNLDKAFRLFHDTGITGINCISLYW